MFLDPYGMQVNWATVKAIAKTQAIDLWYLFPLGVAVNRLLKKDGNIDEAWREPLDRLFGERHWYDAFYERQSTLNLFGETKDSVYKVATFESISTYLVKRLEAEFAGVAENPLYLVNSKNNPLFLLCFAAGNPRGAALAKRIAQHILKK